MAHFAKVENGTVVDLIVVDNADCGGGVFPDSEPVGQAFIAALADGDPRLSGEWLQTSYNTINGLHFPDGVMEFEVVDGERVPVNGSPVGAFRLNFGQIGFVFDPDAGQYGEFRPPVESE